MKRPTTVVETLSKDELTECNLNNKRLWLSLYTLLEDYFQKVVSTRHHYNKVGYIRPIYDKTSFSRNGHEGLVKMMVVALTMLDKLEKRSTQNFNYD